MTFKGNEPLFSQFCVCECVCVLCTVFQRINAVLFASRCVCFFGWLDRYECVYVGV